MSEAVLDNPIEDPGYVEMLLAEDEARRRSSKLSKTRPEKKVKTFTWTPPVSIGDDWTRPPLDPPSVLPMIGAEEIEPGVFLCLLSRGRSNVVFGEPGIGKSIVAMHAAAEVVRGGGYVLYIDFENDMPLMKGRWYDMGLTQDQARRIYHWEADGPLAGLWDEDGEPTRVQELLNFCGVQPFDLIVIDGVGASITMAGGEENSNRDAQKWEQLSIRPFLSMASRPAVLCIDHIPHPSGEGNAKRRGARGASAKLGDARGHVMRFELVKAFSRQVAGMFKLITTKERSGFFPMLQVACTGTVTPMTDTSPLTVRLERRLPVDPASKFWPTTLMDRALQLLKSEPAGEWVSTKTMGDRCGGKGRRAGETAPIEEALDRLQECGFVRFQRRGPGRVWQFVPGCKHPSSFEGWSAGPPEDWEDDDDKTFEAPF